MMGVSTVTTGGGGACATARGTARPPLDAIVAVRPTSSPAPKPTKLVLRPMVGAPPHIRVPEFRPGRGVDCITTVADAAGGGTGAGDEGMPGSSVKSKT